MAVKIFTNLSGDDTGSLSSRVSEGLFTNGTGEITLFYTSSTQVTETGDYYIDIYQEPTSSTVSEVQFALSYGHRKGSGSLFSDENKPSQAVYGLYRNLLLEPSDLKFTFNGVDSEEIVVLNLKRSRFKENIDPGNWQITLKSGSNSITLTDDSLQSLGSFEPANSSASGKKYYNIVSGTIASGPSGSKSSSYGYYGLLYHELGIMVFNASAINTGLSMNAGHSLYLTASNGESPSPTNNVRMYNLIASGSSFKARNEETLNSKHIFVRVKSKEYNFSNNPTYITGSLGKIIDPISKRGVPFTYITGIGLYDDMSNLLATAKLSTPLFKEPGTEALIKVKLDFVWAFIFSTTCLSGLFDIIRPFFT